ncbi:DUF2085 domain-containing protein [uncultured Eubacterium sp.]|uniref:DUF2085 domain-containing protein n=1 Tax=uncultured Eubacterium sp. TaxID=165185 RepID=UPI0026717F42|nr:DUF2085 domain-containing protein [uncultured Eubacterium sp.]
MKTWLCKWLPIVFGCHQRPERSFFVKGKQFPLCARCTGELFGIILTPFLYFLLSRLPVWVFFIMLIPLITDGMIQARTNYESDNIKRVFTGLFFGIGLAMLFMLSSQYCFAVGFDYGKNLMK